MIMTTKLANEILKHFLGGTQISFAEEMYLGLLEDSPGVLGDSSSELTGTSYDRQLITFSIADEVATNLNLVEFTPLGEDWPTVSHVAIFDAETGGNVLFFDDFNIFGVTQELTLIEAGQNLIYNIGDFTVQIFEGLQL